MKFRFVIGTLTVALVLAGTSSPALAAEGGDQQFLLVVPEGTTKGDVVATGVFDGTGREKVVTEEFEEDGTGTVVTKFVFDEGKVFLTVEITSSTFEFDEETCAGSGTATGTYAITGGTGIFKKAKGGGEATAEFAFDEEKNDKGECVEDENSGVFFAKLVGELKLKGSMASAA